jgi:plasmid maintenance system antidote protein VapI
MTSDINARLSLALGWLNLQPNYDAWHAERDSRKLKIARLREVAFSGDR